MMLYPQTISSETTPRLWRCQDPHTPPSATPLATLLAMLNNGFIHLDTPSCFYVRTRSYYHAIPGW